ncbi:uncharacterized protein LOC108147897 [Drosophila elegans]|uniref:uncharacterized protein LOC108147897 n=1 Tax=Drosophila elegans TaxID=30023 RepID=UPI0007E7610C|nr:uncharacterized protein LOC108147897 [Drosophila elegans]XP_017130148.1 uncharacterized protein LOC108147897 [Drosophila elegans]
MKRYVDIHFKEDLMVIKKNFKMLLGASDPGNLKSLRELNDSEMEEIKENGNRDPTLNPLNFNGLYEISSGADFNGNFLDFPDLSQPLPNVSIREQLRLASANRGKVLDWQRNHQKRLEEIWHSQSCWNT